VEVGAFGGCEFFEVGVEVEEEAFFVFVDGYGGGGVAGEDEDLALTDACVLDEALDVGGDVSDGEGSLGFEGEEVIMQHGFDYSVWGLGGMVKNCGGGG
jgi:hypothetical protein